MENVNQIPVVLGAASESSLAGEVRVLERAYFSSYHLWSAKAFSLAAGAIEANHTGGPSFNIQHRAYVINAILAAVAFAEAAINEFYQDAADRHTSYVGSLDVNAALSLGEYWNMTEGKNKLKISILDKYQLALRFCGIDPFDEGAMPYQGANLSIALRNTLVHYKPQTVSAEEDSKLSRQLSGKFPPCALFKGATGNAFFPSHCLGHGCSEWVVGSITGLTDSFFEKIGVSPHYQRAEFGLYNLIKPLV